MLLNGQVTFFCYPERLSGECSRITCLSLLDVIILRLHSSLDNMMFDFGYSMLFTWWRRVFFLFD